MSRHRHYRSPATEWASAYMPQRCEECGQWYFPGAANPLMDAAEGIFSTMMEGMSQMYGDMMGTMMAPSPRGRRGAYPGHQHKHRHHYHRHDCGCRDDCECGGKHCDCHCRCCINDADIVIYSRLGETRVLPVTVENGRRRERQVSLELSEWKTSGGREVSGLTVNAAIAPTGFDLGACEQGEAILVVRSTLVEDQGDVATATTEARFLNVDREKLAERGRFPDVDDCTVLYADLRVEGCDIRPLRVALSLLPRDCGAFEIECRCGCC